MSITAETAKEHAKDPAVLCCRAEAGKVIAPDDLEDPAIFEDLEDSGLLEIPENALTIEQVLGTTLKETTDALIPLTREILDGVKEVEEAAAEPEVAEEPMAPAVPVHPAPPVSPAAPFTGGTIKIHIAEGKGIDLEVPMSVAGSMGVAAPAAPMPVAPEQAAAPAPQAPVAEVEEKVIRSVRRDYLKINKVEFGEETKIEGTTLILRKIEEMCAEAVELEELVESMTFEIITPDRYNEYSETIMDVQPIAAKAEGDIGHGVTRVLDGIVLVVTGTDANGVQIGEFGSSEGELDRNIMWGRPGAPEKGEIFIKTQVTIKEGANME
nr:D-proline reductase (dithiol) proprotein PrdA [Enterococcus sp. 665A]